MPSERIKKQIDRYLDEAESAIDQHDWVQARRIASDILALDPDNADAKSYLAAADRAVSVSQPAGAPGKPVLGSSTVPAAVPTSFANGRYQVKKLLGEGGKKKVYLVHDTVLDRDVAFAQIKTEKLDEDARM